MAGSDDEYVEHAGALSEFAEDRKSSQTTVSRETLLSEAKPSEQSVQYVLYPRSPSEPVKSRSREAEILSGEFEIFHGNNALQSLSRLDHVRGLSPIESNFAFTRQNFRSEARSFAEQLSQPRPRHRRNR